MTEQLNEPFAAPALPDYGSIAPLEPTPFVPAATTLDPIGSRAEALRRSFEDVVATPEDRDSPPPPPAATAVNRVRAEPTATELLEAWSQAATEQGGPAPETDLVQDEDPAGFAVPVQPIVVGITAAGGLIDTDATKSSSAPAPDQLAPAAVSAPDISGSKDAEEEERISPRDGADPELIAALIEVVMQGASDLHVTANSAPTIRIHGGLSQLPGEAWSSDKVRQALFTLLSPEQKQRFQRELELDFAYTVSQNARFRVNFYQQRESIGAAFRIIPTEIKTLGELGVPESVGRFASLPRGLVLVTGPTGSGKSTTLAALIDLVNSSRADHIVTVEDPIEFMHNHKKSLVNQREVGHDTHSFASALKHVLRQDPDVILVGELRDLETISVALTAAETGHLVFATLHTQSAAQTIDRIIDVYPPHQQNQVRAQLAATLQGVVCQTLVKKASGQGRVVATEVLITTPAVSNLIREGQTHQVPTAMQAGGSFGMHTIDQHLADLVNRGVITQQAAVDKAQDTEGMLSLVNRVETRASVMSQTGVDFDDAFTNRGRH
ncbi:type IV pilus twitching motility protein PilT [Leifsonia sp. YIM 134122]|uniref:Type IV pilus twitching motility protein PilT n=1 Tax=Leifsonia stereocauli TaxID=3134136 RepID=A0ABU9W7X4_9MICO